MEISFSFAVVVCIACSAHAWGAWTYGRILAKLLDRLDDIQAELIIRRSGDVMHPEDADLIRLRDARDDKAQYDRATMRVA